MAISAIGTSRTRASRTGERDSARSTSARNWPSVASVAASRIRTRTDKGPACEGSLRKASAYAAEPVAAIGSEPPPDRIKGVHL
jgi:hypothetical protein